MIFRQICYFKKILIECDNRSNVAAWKPNLFYYSFGYQIAHAHRDIPHWVLFDDNLLKIIYCALAVGSFLPIT